MTTPGERSYAFEGRVQVLYGGPTAQGARCRIDRQADDFEGVERERSYLRGTHCGLRGRGDIERCSGASAPAAATVTAVTTQTLSTTVTVTVTSAPPSTTTATSRSTGSNGVGKPVTNLANSCAQQTGGRREWVICCCQLVVACRWKSGPGSCQEAR